MKDNPVYPLVKRRAREYRKLLLFYDKEVLNLLEKYPPNPYNRKFIAKWLNRFSEDIGEYTRNHIIESIEAVIDKTIATYDTGQFSDREKEELKLTIMKEFLLSRFKGKTLDMRINHAKKRLRVNLSKGLNYLITLSKIRKLDLLNLVSYITGKDYREGGTAYRWNSRLLISEMYRAYQFTSREIFKLTQPTEIEWHNSPRHKRASIIDEYAKKTYTVEDLPEYPYPCNDSYFIPLYKKK